VSEVVVDASLAVKWVLEEEDTDRARALLRDWQARSIRRVVPTWFVCEVTNVLYRRIGRTGLPLQDAQLGLDTVMRQVAVGDFGPVLAKRAMELALAFARPAAYDAQYLAFAEQRGCELWTADERLWNATKATLPWVRWVGDAVTPARGMGRR
jgi:predicted nucleic acid-binding protein